MTVLLLCERAKNAEGKTDEKEKETYDLYFTLINSTIGLKINKGIVVNKDRHTGKWSRIESINRFIKIWPTDFNKYVKIIHLRKDSVFSKNAPGTMGYLWVQWTLMPIYYSYQKKKAKIKYWPIDIRATV